MILPVNCYDGITESVSDISVNNLYMDLVTECYESEIDTMAAVNEALCSYVNPNTPAVVTEGAIKNAFNAIKELIKKIFDKYIEFITNIANKVINKLIKKAVLKPKESFSDKVNRNQSDNIIYITPDFVNYTGYTYDNVTLNARTTYEKIHKITNGVANGINDFIGEIYDIADELKDGGNINKSIGRLKYVTLTSSGNDIDVSRTTALVKSELLFKNNLCAEFSTAGDNPNLTDKFKLYCYGDKEPKEYNIKADELEDYAKVIDAYNFNKDIGNLQNIFKNTKNKLLSTIDGLEQSSGTDNPKLLKLAKLVQTTSISVLNEIPKLIQIAVSVRNEAVRSYESLYAMTSTYVRKSTKNAPLADGIVEFGDRTFGEFKNVKMHLA